MKRVWLSLSLLLVVLLFSSFQSASAQNSGAMITTPAEHPRVFITDSQSWEMSGGGGGNWAGFGQAASGGARPQTAEIVKTFGERCSDVITNNIQAKADYVVVLDHEGGKGWVLHRNKVAVFTRISGDSIVSKSTYSLGASVQTACEAIRADWAKNFTRIRDEEASEAAAAAAKTKLVAPQAIQVAESNVTKMSVASNPVGADIEVDGGFVGNTPSTIDVPPGDHMVKVSKAGFKDWERKLKASGGNVNLNVELEAQAK
jgi:hypothetical protein